ncbi:MAG TPA: virulence factor [Roseiflexaceae bacterium]|nr:virulence factor [Roseiflexaceae bacterium]
MATYQILTWHGIPLQVRAREGRDRASAPLPERFQEAVDRAAMAAGVTGSDAYTEALHWSEPQEREGTAREVADAVAAALAAQYPTIDWRAAAESAARTQ